MLMPWHTPLHTDQAHTHTHIHTFTCTHNNNSNKIIYKQKYTTEMDNSLTRGNRLLNWNHSTKPRILLYELLVRESPEAFKIMQIVTFLLVFHHTHGQTLLSMMLLTLDAGHREAILKINIGNALLSSLYCVRIYRTSWLGRKDSNEFFFHCCNTGLPGPTCLLTSAIVVWKL